MQGLLQFSTTDGKDALENIKRDNTKFSPRLAEELRGIAQGAGVPLDHGLRRDPRPGGGIAAFDHHRLLVQDA